MRAEEIRNAQIGDVPMLARIHVQSWRETYTGLLPEEEIAARDESVREGQWTHQIESKKSRIAVLPGLGFAQMGPMREPDVFPDHTEELYCLYLLKKAQGRGLGRALLDRVRGPAPFVALVLETNLRAVEFYKAAGGRVLLRRAEHVGMAAIEELAFGFEGLA